VQAHLLACDERRPIGDHRLAPARDGVATADEARIGVQVFGEGFASWSSTLFAKLDSRAHTAHSSALGAGGGGGCCAMASAGKKTAGKQQRRAHGKAPLRAAGSGGRGRLSRSAAE
jgi:hypothetical protein